MRAALVSSLVAAACVGVLWFRFNAPPPEHGLLYPHDLIYSYYPKVDLIGSRLASFELPLWNPAGCAGMPLLGAIQNAILYPPMWSSALLPAGFVLSLLTLLHLLIAAIGAALLFRAWRAPPILAGALGGVFVFACGLGQTFWPPQVFVIAWLPWMLLCIERAIADAGAWRWWAGLVAVTALQLLAGFPQHVVYTLHIAIPLVLLRAALLARAPGASTALAVRAVSRLALAMVLGAGIAAVQLVPTAELILESERRENLSPADTHYLLKRAGLTKVLSNAVNAEPRNTAFELGKGSGYVGSGTLVLAAVALVVWRRRPLVWGLLALGGASLLLSDGYLGIARGAFAAYASLPVLGSFRSPERLLLLAGFCTVGLAALGASALSATEKPNRIAGVSAAAMAAIAIAAIGNAQAGLVAIATASLIGGAFFVSGRAAAAAGSGARRTIECLAALLLLADVALATGAYGSLRHFPTGWAEIMHLEGRKFMNAEKFKAQQERIGDGRVAFYGQGGLVRPVAGIGPIHDAKRLACYETPVPRAWQQLARIVKAGDFRSMIAASVDPARFDALLDMAGVVEVNEVKGTFVATAERLFPKYEEPAPRLPWGMSVATHRNEDVLPRAYVVGKYEVTTREHAVERVARGDFDYRSTVLLERTPGVAEPRVDRLYPAKIESYEAERVSIATDTPAAGLLVLSDTYYPGWRASVDGEPAEILLANGLFRAVAVPAGEHRVVFAYAPTSFRVGAAISGLSLLGVIGAGVRYRRGSS